MHWCERRSGRRTEIRPSWSNSNSVCFGFYLSGGGVPGDRTGGDGCVHGRMANGEAGSGPFWGKAEWCGEDGYYKMLASSFANLLASGKDKHISDVPYLQSNRRRNTKAGSQSSVLERDHSVGVLCWLFDCNSCTRSKLFLRVSLFGCLCAAICILVLFPISPCT